MSIKGLVTYWGADTTKMRNRLAEIKVMVSRCKVNPLIKDDIANNIDIILRLLQKGKAHNETDNRE